MYKIEAARYAFKYIQIFDQITHQDCRILVRHHGYLVSTNEELGNHVCICNDNLRI